MARKTPAKMKALVERHTEAMKHFSAVLSAKERGDEAPFYREHSSEYYEGLAMGQSMMLETALFEHDCYHGFMYIDANKKPVRVDEAGYAEWRRVYYVK
jgi:hypothetical protein